MKEVSDIFDLSEFRLKTQTPCWFTKTVSTSKKLLGGILMDVIRLVVLARNESEASKTSIFLKAKFNYSGASSFK